MGTQIVLIKVDSKIGGRKLAETIENVVFQNTNEFIKYLKNEKVSDDVLYYTLSQFMDECNDQLIDLENYWVTYVTINS